MITIGVTGGVGAGKSKILSYLEEAWDATVIRLDDVGRHVLDPGTEGYRQAVELFGTGVVLPDGTLDRPALAGIIFKDDALREALDRIVHPQVKAYAVSAQKEAEEKGCRLFVLEAALLIEDHYDVICSEMWYIYADEPTRYSRLRESRGYSDDRIRRTMSSQLPEKEFREHCAFTVDNSGAFDDAKEAVDGRLKALLS